ncbi:protein ENL-like isoform X2 [Sebastes umbrosus]|uniref:protein ENL-like isoform X2 n=1 Tax=Sebastes umbrosus TaxID=72105 RepID=UPI00189D07EB|nr:protein ENL-like isoform X2 [Sebastes umbrosus]XP_037624989.1 protein ENL-like isoform X2 [Sebastes umbrosus]
MSEDVVRGTQNADIQHLIEKVVFQLHGSYPRTQERRNKKKVCFNYNLFFNSEGDHLRCETLTFNNPTREFRRKLIKAGAVTVVQERAEAATRSSPDSPIPPTKKIKTSHVSEEDLKVDVSIPEGQPCV